MQIVTKSVVPGIENKALRVLLISFDNVGDLVFTSAVFDRLRQERADTQLTVWCKEYTKEIAALLPGQPRIFTSDPFWDRSPLKGKGRVRRFLQELRRVSKFKYDLAIIPNHCWRSALIAKLLGIPVRVGFAKNWKNHLFLTHPRERMKMDESVCQQMLSLLQAVGIAANPGHYRLELWTPDPFRREGLVTAQNLVTIHPFAGSAKRCAPLEMWLKFALFLKGEGYGILWLGVTKELDRIREMTSDFLPHEFEDYYPGYEGIDGIAKMTKAGFAFVGHDSGPLHLSHALGVPVLGLYLPGDPLRTFPQGSAPWVQIVHDHPAKLTFEDWINGWRKLKDKIESVKSLG